MVYKSKYANETYPAGTTRIKRSFAWLPFRIASDMVWLETYETLQLYQMKQYEAISQIDLQPKLYSVYEWIDLSHRIITK